MTKKIIYIIIACLFIPQGSNAQQATKTVYIDTPTVCAKVVKIEGNKVYLNIENTSCAQGKGKLPVNIDDNTKEVSIFVNDKPWKTQLAEQINTGEVHDILEKAKENPDKFAVPKNVHAAEASGKAQDIYKYSQSEEFQQKVASESARLQRKLYGDEISTKYYKDARALPQKGKLSSQERLYIFISSSIPKETLRTYTEMVGRLRDPNTSLVMRGFINGAKHVIPTTTFVTSLLVVDPGCNPLKEKCETFKAQVIIDPMLFSKYNIDKVPAFVYVPAITVNDKEMSEGLESNINVTDYDVIYGAVNLDYVLEALHKERTSKGIEALQAALREGFYNK